MQKDGFPGISTPAEYLKATEDALDRLRHASTSPSAAQAFFSMAAHYPDWRYYGQGRREAVVKGSAGLQIARHLSNSGKHFRPTDKRNAAMESWTAAATPTDVISFDGKTWPGPIQIVRLSPSVASMVDPSGRQHFPVLELAEFVWRELNQLPP